MLVNNRAPEALVSVIIPTYNRPAFLKEAIQSAVRQTYKNIEIVVSDNCSPENPQEIVEDFQDPRIRFWRNAVNLGMFANVINAFKMAQGKYVATLLDDDLWEEDFLEKLVPHLEANSDLALAFCDHYIVEADNTINYPGTDRCTQAYKRDRLKEGVYQPFCKVALIDGSVSSAFAAVIRNNGVDWDEIPPQVGVSWDVYINYLCCRSGLGAYYYPARLTRNRIHPQTETMLGGRQDAQAKIRKAKAEIFCYERFIEDERLQEFKPYFQQKLVQANTSLGIGLLRDKQIEEARPYFWSALRQKFNLRTVAALMLSFTPPQVASRF